MALKRALGTEISLQLTLIFTDSVDLVSHPLGRRRGLSKEVRCNRRHYRRTLFGGVDGSPEPFGVIEKAEVIEGRAFLSNFEFEGLVHLRDFKSKFSYSFGFSNEFIEIFPAILISTVIVKLWTWWEGPNCDAKSVTFRGECPKISK